MQIGIAHPSLADLGHLPPSVRLDVDSIMRTSTPQLERIHTLAHTLAKWKV
jgi:hypothetical protein